MAATGKLVAHVEINYGGDVFHNFYRYKPNDLSSICDCIHGVDLVSGQQGSVGSITRWTFNLDGKKQSMAVVLEDINETNHKLLFNVLESDLPEIYKSLKITFHVEPKGDKEVVTWTVEFAKKNTNVPDPTSFMDIFISEIRDIDAYLSTKLVAN